MDLIKTALQAQAFAAGKNKYNITKWVYPLDLSTNPAFSGNKVVFFINVATNSKSTKAGLAGNKYELWGIPESDQYKVTGQALGKLAGEAGGFAGVPVASKMQRLSTAIALYIPNALMQATSVSWDEEDTSSVMNEMLDAGSKALGAPSEDGVVGGVKQAGNVVGSTVSAGAQAGMAKSFENAKRAQKILRVTPGNSKKELLFSAVNYRTFEFNYQFSPKSTEEAENVMNIIRTFKHHMLPEYAGEAKAFYIYPSEFNVKYYMGDAENKYIEKQMTAVLEGVSVDYTPNGQFNTFENGMPQQINLALRFKELSTPSKETSPYDSHGV